jgi:arginyl-tRNA synthetase
MATAANPIDQLAQRVEGLTLQNVTADFPTTHADVNPYDFWRAHLTKVLNGITGVDPKIIYPTINWTSGLDKGDFVVAVAAFRLKGTKPDVLAQEWAEKVCEPA